MSIVAGCVGNPDHLRGAVDAEGATRRLARLHNLVTPTDDQGQDLQQINPCPAAVCASGSGDQTSLQLTVDAAAARGGLLTKTGLPTGQARKPPPTRART